MVKVASRQHVFSVTPAISCGADVQEAGDLHPPSRRPTRRRASAFRSPPENAEVAPKPLHDYQPGELAFLLGRPWAPARAAPWDVERRVVFGMSKGNIRLNRNS